MNSLRSLLMIGLCVGLSACGNASGPNDPVRQLLTRMASTGQPAQPALDVAALKAGLTPAVLAQINGPVLIAQIPDRDAVAVLTRVAQNRGVDTYLTPDGVSISLRDGVIVATRGLGFDLMIADVAEVGDALRGQRKTATRVHQYLDGENGLVTDTFACVYEAERARRITETCKSAAHTFRNTYVLGANGAALAARQWVSEEIGTIITEIID